MGNKSYFKSKSGYLRYKYIGRLFDTRVSFDLRVTMIIAMAGAIANTLGTIANLALYGMNIPTACCGFCALFIIWIYLFQLTDSRYKIASEIMLVLLTVFEFPLLVFTYGAVMYPYMIIGYLALLMLTEKRKRVILCISLSVYDVCVIAISSLYPYIFGPQDSVGLMGSAIITYVITLGALTACVISWKGVSEAEMNEVDGVIGSLTRVGIFKNIKKTLADFDDREYSILFFDVDNFKVANLVYGMDGGNNLLKQIYEMLINSFLEPELVGRMNADHFVCLVENSKLNYERFDELCSVGYEENGRQMQFNMQCGIYPISDRGMDVESMCDRANAAMEWARSNKNANYRVYDGDIDFNYREENELLKEVEKAVHNRAFEPFFQPIVDCKTGRIVSAEALARWIHPERGVIPPYLFIPVLEKKRLITELDEIIFSKVSDLIEERFKNKKYCVPISTNLSRIDLYDVNMMESIKNTLDKSECRNSLYRFELTESVYELLSEKLMSVLDELKLKGSIILVDDFGSGYSSLGVIADYDFDYIKLDMAFASKLDSSRKVRSMVKSLIKMAHNLGAKVIAEGVETKSQFEFLSDCGCDCVQGYLFFKPMPKDEFVEVIESQYEAEMCK